MRAVVLPLLAIAIALCAAPDAPRAAEGDGEVHLLAIGICPPYRRGISVEVCSNTVEELAVAAKGAGLVTAERTTLLTDEEATGPNVLATLSALSERLDRDDRLLLYVVAHGGTFGDWAAAYENDRLDLSRVTAGIVDPEDYVMAFWTREEPRVPALAIAERAWLTASTFLENIAQVPARVSLVLDSCDSGHAFEFFKREHDEAGRIDFLATSSMSVQLSNIDGEHSLFGGELARAIGHPRARSLGEAFAHAATATVLKASAMCGSLRVHVDQWPRLFPDRPPPAARNADGFVSVPRWACTQVPTIVDTTGETSALPLDRP
jgi:hypothetical protein